MVAGKAAEVERPGSVGMWGGGLSRHGPGERPLHGEALGAPRGRLESGERRSVVAAAFRMPDVVRARSQRPAHPEVDHVEAERVMDAEMGMQAVGRGPGAKAHSCRG